MVPLLIAPHGGMVEGLPVQRTFSTGRSVEYDVLLLAGSPPPAPDAIPARESEAGASSSQLVDPRVLLMVEECWRHAKVIGAWGDGIVALGQAGCRWVGWCGHRSKRRSGVRRGAAADGPRTACGSGSPPPSPDAPVESPERPSRLVPAPCTGREARPPGGVRGGFDQSDPRGRPQTRQRDHAACLLVPA